MSLAAKRGELLASAAENANPRKWDFEHISLNFLAKSDERLIVNILLRVREISAIIRETGGPISLATGGFCLSGRLSANPQRK